jgi:hypothetical protein
MFHKEKYMMGLLSLMMDKNDGTRKTTVPLEGLNLGSGVLGIKVVSEIEQWRYENLNPTDNRWEITGADLTAMVCALNGDWKQTAKLADSARLCKIISLLEYLGIKWDFLG